MSRKPPHAAEAPRRPRSLTVWLTIGVSVAILPIVGLSVLLYGLGGSAEAGTSSLKLDDIPVDGKRAYGYLEQLCRLGPRPSGSKGMAAQQKLLEEHFTRLGGRVRFQRFEARHPETNVPVPMANLIVEWHPERTDRIMLCAHYDTLPYPMLDRRNPRGVFVGANDGASGVALLMELAHDMASLETPFGVDFVLFDGEEYIFRPTQPYFLGSIHFAEDYVKHPPAHRYAAALLLDMIGDADLQIFQERNTMWWDDSRPLVHEIWNTAKRLGVREFIPKKKHEINDDHLALHNTAKIPACVLIDFDYPAWHTQADVPARCSALSLAKVGWVVREWLVATRLSPRQPDSP